MNYPESDEDPWDDETPVPESDSPRVIVTRCAVPPHVIFAGLGLLARKIAEDIEKDEDVKTRVAHLKYRIEKLKEKRTALDEEIYASEEALDYLCRKDSCLGYVDPQKPHVLKELAEWADELTEFLKIKPLFNCK